MQDNGTCPYCQGVFEVTADMYGFGVHCPLCGENIDILADPKYYIGTPFGAMPLGTVKQETLVGGALSAIMLRLQKKVNELGKVND